MEIRLTTRTTSGRPILAGTVMLALLAGCVGLVWLVTRLKSTRPIEVGRPVAIRGLGLALRPPARWPGQISIDGNSDPLAQFIDPRSSRRMPRDLTAHRLPGPPMDAPAAAAAFFPVNVGRLDQPPQRLRIGPLVARQFTRRDPQLQEHIVRLAVVGGRQFALLQLACLGPPTPWEYRLMDRVAEEIEPLADSYQPAERLSDAMGVRLAGQAGRWLVSPFDEESRGLTLLPAASMGEDSFWGLVGVRWGEIEPWTDLKEALAAALAHDPAAIVPPPVPGQRVPRTAAPVIEQRPIGAAAVWRARTEQEQVVRLVYAFHPLATPTDTADESAAQAELDRVVYLIAWAAAEDEPAAVRAIEQLVTAVRIQR